MADRRGARGRQHRGWTRGNYHAGGNRQQWRGHLEAGQRGFVCTCNNRERECVREALNLLNEYADLLFGREDWRATSGDAGSLAAVTGKKDTEGPEGAAMDADEDEDIAVTLQREVQDLQASTRRPVNQQRFRVLNSGAKNYVFINSTVPDPVQLVHRLLTDIKTSQRQRCRFLLRMLPVEATCRTQLDELTSVASKVFDKYFAEGGKSFAIIYKCRNNSGINREAVIEALAELVKLKNASNYADLSNPQLAVLVEVVRNVCCLSVVPDYFQLAKYNVLEVAAPAKEKGQTGVGERAAPDGQDSDVEQNADGSGGSKQTDAIDPALQTSPTTDPEPEPSQVTDRPNDSTAPTPVSPETTIIPTSEATEASS